MAQIVAISHRTDAPGDRADHVIDPGSITAAMLAAGAGGTPPYTVYVPPGGAAGDIQAAIDAMPAEGGIIQLGAGIYTPVSLNSATPDRSILIRGMGSVSAGANPPTTISFSGSGSGSFITVPLTTANAFRDMKIMYSNSAFSGNLISCYGGSTIGADTTQFGMDNVVLWGPHTGTETATLLYVPQTTQMQLNRVDFNGAGYAVQGARVVNVASVSVANPTTITTTQAHGWLTGASVQFGGLNTTNAIANGTFYTITVTGANTFTIPVNVTVVTVGTGFVYNPLIDSKNDAAILFNTCEFRNQVIAPIKNVGEAWTVLNCNFEPLANGDVAAITHDPGHRAYTFNFIGNLCIDQSTTNACVWIKWAGFGLNVRGNVMAGRQVANDTAVLFDENGNDGYNITGNQFDNMWRGLDFGATTGHGHGSFLDNAFTSPLGTTTRIAGTIPRGIGFYDGAAGTVPDGYIFTGGATATVQRFDGDILTQLYRTGAGILQTDGQLYVADRTYVGFGTASVTHIYGGATDAVSGMVAESSGAAKDLLLESKGTGLVKIDSFNGTGGTQITKGLQLPGTISPTQLVANTDNWAPTSQSTAWLLRINVDAARSIFGLVAEAGGRVHRLYNSTAFSVTLGHQAGTSTAANRFICPNAVDFIIRQFGSVDIVYSATDSRWLVLGA